MDALEPLRQRYVSQHHNLRKFYYECSNLKYLTGLINVPKLGQVSWRGRNDGVLTHCHQSGSSKSCRWGRSTGTASPS